jgi:hypothetical protein
MYMSLNDSAKLDQINVDTTTIHPAELLFTKPNSASFVPAVVQGNLKIPEAAKKEEKKP